MAKEKYRFNKTTLNYELIEYSLKDKLKRALYWLSYTAIVVFIALAIYPYFVDSPKERELKRNISDLGGHIGRLDKHVDFLENRLIELEDRDDNIYRTVFEAEPIPKSIRKAGYGGSDFRSNIDGFSYDNEVRNLQLRVDQLTKKLAIQSKSLDEVQGFAKNKLKMMASIPGIQPISNKDLTRLASGFGMRLHPIHKIRKMHSGLDFSAPTGSEIYATGDGVVEKVKYRRNGYGKHVVVNHGYGYKTLYAHMSKYIVRRGQKVKRGQILGYVGNTGSSTAPHLHYEVIKDKRKINPISYFYNDLTPEEYEKMIQISSTRNQSFD
jgi:murein DD-endopeptidase MepM/ murein hydrolase activator NlpD